MSDTAYLRILFACVLFQSKVDQSLVELTDTRSRIQQLQGLLLARKKEAEMEVSGLGEEFHTDTLAQ